MADDGQWQKEMWEEQRRENEITIKDMREDDEITKYIEIAVKALNFLIYILSVIFVLVVSSKADKSPLSEVQI